MVTATFMVAAPASIVAALVITQDVLAAFAIYHLGMCMVVPYLYERFVHDLSQAEMVLAFGLRDLRDKEAWLAGSGVGLLMGLGVLVPYLAVGQQLIPAGEVQAALAAWNLGPEDTMFLFVYMLVFNSGAEELFWRGYVHERLQGWSNRPAALAVTSAAFASYHFFTVFALSGDELVAAVALVGVFVGGMIWAGLRERYGSVLPALLAHGGGTLGYMTVYVVWLA